LISELKQRFLSVKRTGIYTREKIEKGLSVKPNFSMQRL